MKTGLTFIVALAGLSTAALAYAPQSSDIVDTATAAGNFKTLTSLVQKAGLVDTLKGTGPFTVLAPTDAAFAKLPKKTMDKLSASPDLLKKVLTYHVISGSALAGSLKNKEKFKTVEGENVTVHISGSVVKFAGSTVTSADIRASNGVIHAIDKVLIPPSGLKSASTTKVKKARAPQG